MINEKEISFYVLPKYSLVDERFNGAEVLARWMHPEKGLLKPKEFLPELVQTGEIWELDCYVLESACQKMSEWIEAGWNPDPISVNVASQTFLHPRFYDVIHELFDKYDLKKNLIWIEITESVFAEHREQAKAMIQNLREAGFILVLDDYGRSYSSIKTLNEMEMDVLKVDMAFFDNCKNLQKSEQVMSSIIKLANWLGISVTAECVETDWQQDFAEESGCFAIQGYNIAKPIPIGKYEEDYVKQKQKFFSAESVIRQNTTKRNMTVLVIDDSEMERELLKKYLHDEFHVHASESAEEGLIYLKKNQNRVHLILLDYMMPGMSGMDFLKMCQKDEKLRYIPKIMITSNERSEDQIKAFREGAYDYLTKPLVPEVVRARIHHILDINNQLRASVNAREEYRHQAEIDKATGLLNKATFQNEAMQNISRYPEEEKALLVVDIDDFKKINDEYGHLQGDEVIKLIADELVKNFRRTDLIGRFGGDEFVVLMTSLSRDEMAKRKAEDVIKAVIFKCTQELHLNASISMGIAFYRENDSFDKLFGRADQALYEAKNTGKGKSVVFGEKVPAITDDNKPVIAICGENPQLFPAIALAYGDGAGFLHITTMEELKAAFDKYKGRLRAICLEMEKKHSKADSAEFYQLIEENGGGKHIPILGVCEEGNMNQLSEAIELGVSDILTMPPQMDVIQRKISKAILNCEAK